MGYSIDIRVKSKVLRQRFLTFLQANFRHWSVVCGRDPSEWHGSARGPTDDISYGKTETSIGFDYQSGMYGFERDYIYSVIRWMAIKVGDRKDQMPIEGTGSDIVTHQFPSPTPYYIYDGEEDLNPVLVTTEEQAAALPKVQRSWAVDEWGFRIGPTAVDLQFSSCTEQLGAIILGDQGLEFKKETDALGGLPEGEAAEEEWMARRRAVYLKYLKPEIDKNIALIRQEIQRLDQLWAGES